VGFEERIDYGKIHATIRMILPDREIKKLLAKKLIVIDPAPTADAYASTSVDLTLDPLLRVFRAVGEGIIIDPTMPGYKVRTLLDGLTDPVTIPPQGWDFVRGVLVLGWTKERIELNLTARVAARVEGKSGLARLGLAITCHRADNSCWICGHDSA
jgi:dCTP deaminase